MLEVSKTKNSVMVRRRETATVGRTIGTLGISFFNYSLQYDDQHVLKKC